MSDEAAKNNARSLTIFTVLVMMLSFFGLLTVILANEHANIPTADDQLAQQRLKTLAELNAENVKVLTTYRWIDKNKGIVGIPIDRAMNLVLGELQANKPHPAGQSLHATTGDPKAGKIVFIQCAACHALDPDENKQGPTLAGIFGRKAGSVEDFNYSDANKNSGIVWDEATLRQYLPDPQKLVPGTKMTFPGLKDPKQVEDVIAYLKEAAKQ